MNSIVPLTYQQTHDRVMTSLQHLIKNGESRFIIFPFSGNGMLVADILTKVFGITPVAFVDDSISKVNSDVYPVSHLSKFCPKDCLLLLTSDRFSPRYDTIRHWAYQAFPRERVYDLFEMFVGDFDQKAYWLRCFSEIVYNHNLKGNVAECGVFQGAFASLINKFFSDRKCYLFDTFEGFDDRDITVEKTIHNSDFMEERNLAFFSNTSVSNVLSRIRYPDKIVLKKGYVPNTFEGIEDEFCFVHLDMDLYAPMFEALKFFYPRMVKGGALLLHDYYVQDLPGVRKAVVDYEQSINKQLCLVPHVASIIIMKTD